MCQIKFNGAHLALGLPSLLQIGIAVTALYYGITNLDQMCGDSFIHLAIWLIVQGAVMAFVTLGWGPSFCLGLPGRLIYGLVAAMYGLFNIVWSIIGGIILWRDSTSCYDLDRAFYLASMVVVIASLVLAFCTLCCSSKHIKDAQSNEKV